MIMRLETGTEATPADTSSGLSEDSKRLALFVVLPLFLCCYGGSCIIYCVHKIIRNCTRARRVRLPPDDEKPMTLPPPSVSLSDANGLGARSKMAPVMMPHDAAMAAKRPLSAGKHSAKVAPAAVP